MTPDPKNIVASMLFLYEQRGSIAVVRLAPDGDAVDTRPAARLDFPCSSM
jgi:hypothetical protein